MVINVERCSKNLWRVVFARPGFDKSHEAYNWCKAQWGRGGRKIDCLWRYGWDNQHHYFYFTKEENLMLFLLRWQ
jgi:hypothetical protein